MLLAHVLMRGRVYLDLCAWVEAKPWVATGRAVWIGGGVAALVPGYLIYYAVQPLPGRVGQQADHFLHHSSGHARHHRRLVLSQSAPEHRDQALNERG